ncbi:glycosyltransferase family 4 protein [Labrys sp. LIt4]|uniref:glycosyltransferase family 4 protein n=1 Tax=Labrys sp. LIt4 TaxID=2821355 RepID=UPI001ADF2E8D|nr:glycosyltransferase family 1 protein [Labrys sp. LIt4]MBP0579045.1 glycosyltransferase family 4 protein [Labrys sp. LIt4]
MNIDTLPQSSAIDTAPAPRALSATMTEPLSFAINGRFLTQPVTGVQRYAREITAHIDDLLQEQGGRASLYLPGSSEAPAYRAIQTKRSQRLRGHFWEQMTLPTLDRRFLLNLCNLGPVARRRQIVCIHDANVANMPASYSKAFRAVYGTLLPLLVRRAAAITTVSHFSAGELARHLPIAREDIVVLPNGHEHVFRWNASRSSIRSKHRFERPYVFIIGSRARHKNVAMVLELAEALDELGIDIVVTGGQSSIFATEEHGIPAPNVRFMGFVDDDDLAALLQGALCLLFPSFTEGFGLPIIEAMALGCPVISSDRASMPEVCGEAALLAPPDQPATWLRHIQSLASSDTLRSAFVEQGRKRVEAFSWRKSAQGYLDLIRERHAGKA